MPETNDPPKWTDGARLLSKYLTKKDLTIPEFCAKANAEHGLKLDRRVVKRVLDGDRGQRPSVDFALAIAVATGNAIRFGRWSTDTLSLEKPEPWTTTAKAA